MQEHAYEKFDGRQVTDDMLQEAAVLFSDHYGVWGEHAAQATGGFAKAGSRVHLNRDRLRAQSLYDPATCFYVRVTVNGRLAGNAFASRWTVNNKSVCWVTQLVVHRDYRKRGLAGGLLNLLKDNSIDLYGLMSSHPAACLAAARAFRDVFSAVRLDVIAKYAQEVLESSPIGYVKDAKLRGNLFSPGDRSGLVSCADSRFFVDHTEPLEVLARVRERTEWPLGELFDGHEFLVIFEPSHRFRSTSAGGH